MIGLPSYTSLQGSSTVTLSTMEHASPILPVTLALGMIFKVFVDPWVEMLHLPQMLRSWIWWWSSSKTKESIRTSGLVQEHKLEVSLETMQPYGDGLMVGVQCTMTPCYFSAEYELWSYENVQRQREKCFWLFEMQVTGPFKLILYMKHWCYISICWSALNAQAILNES